jgi:hypothetical protein
MALDAPLEGSDSAIDFIIIKGAEMNQVVKWYKVVIVVIVISFVTGCSGMSRREQRVLSGGAIGTAAGVGIAAATGGSLIVGGAVGAAAGAVGGVVVDEMSRR